MLEIIRTKRKENQMWIQKQKLLFFIYIEKQSTKQSEQQHQKPNHQEFFLLNESQTAKHRKIIRKERTGQESWFPFPSLLDNEWVNRAIEEKQQKGKTVQ